MGSKKREHKRQKNREKKKKKDARRRQSAARKRAQQTQAAATRPVEASNWPAGECYLGEDWYDKAAGVPAIFSRVHPGGQVIVAVFELDLASGGVRRARIEGPGHPGILQNLLISISEEQMPLVEVAPALVVKAVDACWDHADARGVDQVEGFPQVRALFGTLKPDEHTPEVEVGSDEAPDAAPRRGGLLSSLLGRFS